MTEEEKKKLIGDTKNEVWLEALEAIESKNTYEGALSLIRGLAYINWHSPTKADKKAVIAMANKYGW